MELPLLITVEISNLPIVDRAGRRIVFDLGISMIVNSRENDPTKRKKITRTLYRTCRHGIALFLILRQAIFARYLLWNNSPLSWSTMRSVRVCKTTNDIESSMPKKQSDVSSFFPLSLSFSWCLFLPMYINLNPCLTYI